MSDHIIDVSVEAVADRILELRKYAPYRFGGAWFIAQTGEKEFKSYRSKSSAVKRSIGGVYWKLS